MVSPPRLGRGRRKFESSHSDAGNPMVGTRAVNSPPSGIGGSIPSTSTGTLLRECLYWNTLTTSSHTSIAQSARGRELKPLTVLVRIQLDVPCFRTPIGRGSGLRSRECDEFESLRKYIATVTEWFRCQAATLVMRVRFTPGAPYLV